MRLVQTYIRLAAESRAYARGITRKRALLYRRRKALPFTRAV